VILRASSDVLNRAYVLCVAWKMNISSAGWSPRPHRPHSMRKFVFVCQRDGVQRLWERCLGWCVFCVRWIHLWVYTDKLITVWRGLVHTPEVHHKTKERQNLFEPQTDCIFWPSDAIANKAGELIIDRLQYMSGSLKMEGFDQYNPDSTYKFLFCCCRLKSVLCNVKGELGNLFNIIKPSRNHLDG